MKKVLYSLIIGCFTAVAAVSCTGKYEDINSHPYQPGDLTADDYALGSAMNNLAGCVISPDVNTAQFTDCLLGGPLGGYFADSKASWNNTISNYNPTDDWTRVLLKSDKVLPVLYSNMAVVELVSQNTNNPVPLAIANVIKVATMHRVTDAYGPIPYSKIGADGAINTPYDSEEEVYNKFFDELDAAIAVLNENPGSVLMPTADYIYQGNIQKWIRFANSLKLRLAMRIVNVAPELSKTMAEAAVNPANGGVIESNSDNAAWRYFSGAVPNPLFVAKEYNKLSAHEGEDVTNFGKDCLTGGDAHVAADIICYMNGYKDNRRAAYFTNCEWVDYEYVGMRRGIIIPDLATTGHKYSGLNMKPTDPLYWMNAAEVAFLRAEAAGVYNFNMGGDAETFYNTGIRLSFEQWGVDGAEAYLTNETLVPETYTDPAGVNSYTGSLSDVTVKWNPAASKEEMQERIIIQKWIANWQLGNEAWADYRRTGFPKMLPATPAGNKSGGLVDSNRGARRIPFPTAEYSDNADNINKALQLLGGPDNMATDLWWAKRN